MAVEISDLRTPSLRVRGPQLVPHAARKQGRILLRIIELKIIKNLFKKFFWGGRAINTAYVFWLNYINTSSII